MAITPPNFAKNAIPTVKGWVSPKGELLKAQKISQSDIDEWNGVTVTPAAPAEAPVTGNNPDVVVLDELSPEWPFPVGDKPDSAVLPKLSSLTKAELEEYARTTFSVELDKRLTKKELIEQVGQLQANQ